MLVLPAQAQSLPDRGDLGWMETRDDYYEADQWRWQYPTWAYDQVEGTDLERDFDLRYASNPFMLHGDFDGDGRLDVAAWVEQRTAPHGATPEIGVVVVHRSGGVHYFATGGPNWELYPEGDVARGVGEEQPPVLQGDALLFVKPESASVLWYWDGLTYRRYQQGD